MLGNILLGTWSGAIASAALYFSLAMNAPVPKADDGSSEPQENLVYSAPEFLVAPVVNNNKVSGFLFSQVVLHFDPDGGKAQAIPIGLIMQDSYNTFLIGNDDFSFPRVTAFEIDKFKAGFKRTINASLGAEAVKAVYINQVNYIEADRVRHKQKLRAVYKNTETKEPDKKPDKKKKQSKEPASGH